MKLTPSKNVSKLIWQNDLECFARGGLIVYDKLECKVLKKILYCVENEIWRNTNYIEFRWISPLRDANEATF
jgi:hypothetical protein